MSSSQNLNHTSAHRSALDRDVQQAEQLALKGLAPRKSRSSRKRAKMPAEQLPYASVMLDIQATHLGRTFDYVVEQSQDEQAQPGVRVRVRFGRQLVDGIIWSRSDTTQVPSSSLKYIERVVSPLVVLDSGMRADIERIADDWGGTPANIIRLAVPPRVARVDTWLMARQQRVAASASSYGVRSRQSHSGAFSSTTGWFEGERAEHMQHAVQQAWERIQQTYSGAQQLYQTLQARTAGTIVWDHAPGSRLWAKDLAWATLQAMLEHRDVVLILPDIRLMNDMAGALAAYGLRPYVCNDSEQGTYTGDVATLSSGMTPQDRYQSYMALALGQVHCVIGLRAAMYAPVQHRPVFIVVDDNVYQYADGFMPYPQVREVVLQRAKDHDGTVILAGHTRSAQAQWMVDHEQAVEVHAFTAVLKDQLPWMKWLNPQAEAAALDPTSSSRFPSYAVEVIRKALQRGPVLVAMPYGQESSVFACRVCHKLARCRVCSGPLQSLSSAESPQLSESSQPSQSQHLQSQQNAVMAQCAWCGKIAVDWQCSYCQATALSVVRVGSQETVEQIHNILHNVPIVVSNPNQPRGIVEHIDQRSVVVVASFGAQPRIMTPSGYGSYAAVLIVDAWISLYAQGVDARLDLLTQWMQCAAMAASRAREGQVLLIGDCDECMAQSLLRWNPRILAHDELAEREAAMLPPVVSVATVWGEHDVVQYALEHIGVLDGNWAPIDIDGMRVPNVLGPRPIAPDPLEGRQLDGTTHRVRAIVRVPRQYRHELALRLRAAVAHHDASREKGELRFALDPKNVL